MQVLPVVQQLKRKNSSRDTVPKFEPKNESSDPNICAEMNLKYNCDEDHLTEEESSIIDVNNDQMFDDTVFTEYDDQNISTMTQKMSKHWRKKFKDEDKKEARKEINQLSLEQLVHRQMEKTNTATQILTDEEAKFSEDNKYITDNRRRRTKQINGTNADFRLSSSEIGKISFSLAVIS